MGKKKKDNMLGFKILKAVLGGVFKFYYNPTIIGGENIPLDGAIVVVGNHIHMMDQCLPLLSTKRAVHYMAKKEYFDNKMFAWFFKMAGCISVDRSKKDDVAKGLAMDVLNNGNALGLFPEGTRNGLKQEKIDELYKICKDKYENYEEFVKNMKKQKTSQVLYLEELMEKKKIKKKDFIKNIYRVDEYLLELVNEKVITKSMYEDKLLLPFKFGAVSMAKKSDAYLIPFGLSGTYKFRSRDLTVRIGKPFKVGEDLEEANKKLRKEILKLIKENKQNSGK